MVELAFVFVGITVTDAVAAATPSEYDFVPVAKVGESVPTEIVKPDKLETLLAAKTFGIGEMIVVRKLNAITIGANTLNFRNADLSIADPLNQGVTTPAILPQSKEWLSL